MRNGSVSKFSFAGVVGLGMTFQAVATTLLAAGGSATVQDRTQAVVVLTSNRLRASDNQPESRSLKLDGLFYETAGGRVSLPASSTTISRQGVTVKSVVMTDGRTVRLSVTQAGGSFVIRLSARPNTGIVKWGLAVQAEKDEYYTGLMERVVDGPQQASWAPGRSEAMNLRGQKIDMIIKPTTSIYAPFYLSSRGYGV
ncbi:MAG TPA: hypothetical protein VFV34_10495, partial [Blastocatellia bacterium]|nr:hypothetical protein [Blastocatellia bacterium]